MAKRRPDPDEKRRETLRLLHLAELGEAPAQNALAAKLAQGYFMKRDVPGALYWYAQAAKQGYTHAKWNAGVMLVEGDGLDVPRIDVGMQLIEQAAMCGDVSARTFLSHCYASGKLGKGRDQQKSASWAQKARDDHDFLEYGTPFDIEAYSMRLAKPQIEWD